MQCKQEIIAIVNAPVCLVVMICAAFPSIQIRSRFLTFKSTKITAFLILKVLKLKWMILMIKKTFINTQKNKIILSVGTASMKSPKNELQTMVIRIVINTSTSIVGLKELTRY